MITGEPIFQKNSDEEQMEAIINIVGESNGSNSPELKEKKTKGKGWNSVNFKHFLLKWENI